MNERRPTVRKCANMYILLNSFVKKVNPFNVHNAKFICMDHHDWKCFQLHWSKRTLWLVQFRMTKRQQVRTCTGSWRDSVYFAKTKLHTKLEGVYYRRSSPKRHSVTCMRYPGPSPSQTTAAAVGDLVHSSSRFGDCSYYNFLLSENNSMATHKSGLQVFSSGLASTWTRSSYSMSVCVICLLAHERSAIFSHGGMIRTW